MKTFDGYKKQALTDVYALLAGGGHKPLSEFSMAHTHPYLPLNGGTMLGSIKFNSNSLPQKTLSYVCGIDAFADGGEMGWMRGSDFVAQYAPTKTGIGASGTWSISITGNAATATNADKVDGYHVNGGSNNTLYGSIPVICSDGVMEVGKYIDFHNDNSGKYDYSTRL